MTAPSPAEMKAFTFLCACWRTSNWPESIFLIDVAGLPGCPQPEASRIAAKQMRMVVLKGLNSLGFNSRFIEPPGQRYMDSAILLIYSVAAATSALMTGGWPEGPSNDTV